MADAFNRQRSLQELEQEDWGEPTFPSRLVATAHRLRRKPPAEFVVEDLRLMIGQQIGLHFLIPLALERLDGDPPADGDYYRGDLLHALAGIDEAFWTDHPDLRERGRALLRQGRALLPSLTNVERDTMLKILAKVPPSLLG